MAEHFAINRSTGDFLRYTLPSGCVPARFESFDGLGLLTCNAGTSTQLYSITPFTDWQNEGMIPLDSTTKYSSRMSRDGTLLLWQLQSDNAAPVIRYVAHAFIRTPNPPEQSQHWRVRTFDNALQLIPYYDGNTIVVARGGERTDLLRILMDTPGDGVHPIGQDIQVLGAAMDLHIVDRRLRLRCTHCLKAWAFRDEYDCGALRKGEDPCYFWLNQAGALTTLPVRKCANP